MKYLIILITILLTGCAKKVKICDRRIYTVTEIGQCTHARLIGATCSVVIDDSIVVNLSRPSVKGERLLKCNVDGSTEYQKYRGDL